MRRRPRVMLVPAALLAASLIYLAAALMLAPGPGLAPLIAGGLATALCAIVLAARLSGRARAAAAFAFGGGGGRPEAPARPGLRREAAECLWAAGCALCFVLLGVVAGSALFVAVYQRLRGGESLRFSAATGLAAGAALALTFEVMLDVRLARGVFLDGWSGMF